MTPRKTLETHLATSDDLDVETTLRGRTYFEGRVWVLLDSWRLAETEDLEVRVAVSPGSDLESLLYRLIADVKALPGYQVTDYDVQYGSPPIPGRNQKEADWASVTVSTPCTPEDSA